MTITHHLQVDKIPVGKLVWFNTTGLGDWAIDSVGEVFTMEQRGLGRSAPRPPLFRGLFTRGRGRHRV